MPWVPPRVLDKWVREEMAFKEQDLAQIRNESNRNELERQMLQLQKLIRGDGSHVNVMTDSARVQIDQRLAEAEAMLAQPDAPQQVCRSSHSSQELSHEALTRALPIARSDGHSCRSV